ncbi:MAG: hypothetical protein K6F17_03020 [Lachnospiraceae bacterium]|nr:hypothetical protein [Lachnospiraceae bacterium]
MSVKQRARRLTAAYWVPIVNAFIFAPQIVTSNGDPTDAFRGMMIAYLCQLMLPVCAVWWPVLFSYESMVSKGNELLYVKNRNKLGYYLLALVIYCVCVIPAYMIMNKEIWEMNALCEYVRFVIGCMFFVSLFYMLNYVTGKYILSTIVCAAYALSFLFFDTNKSLMLVYCEGIADWKLIRDHYLFYLVVSVVMFAVGYVFNRNSEKYLK